MTEVIVALIGLCAFLLLIVLMMLAKPRTGYQPRTPLPPDAKPPRLMPSVGPQLPAPRRPRIKPAYIVCSPTPLGLNKVPTINFYGSPNLSDMSDEQIEAFFDRIDKLIAYKSNR